MNWKRNAGMIALSVLIILGLVLITGCKKAGEKTAERMAERAIERASGGKAQVDLSRGGAKIKTKEGEMEFGTSSEWPGDLPSDIPKFESGKVEGVTKTAMGDNRTWHVILKEVEDAAVNSYVEGLKNGGWTIQMTTTTAEGAYIQAVKDPLILVVAFSKDQKTLNLNIQAPKEE